MSCAENERKLRELFNGCSSAEEKYEKIIELGRKLPLFDPSQKIPSNLVAGCQSVMYLHTVEKEGRLFFNADSEALISKGLAALLIAVYSGEEPKEILSHPPTFLRELNILQSLSPTRANGALSLLNSIHQSCLMFS
jgi:cysteine desulfuration protein SufE